MDAIKDNKEENLCADVLGIKMQDLEEESEYMDSEGRKESMDGPYALDRYKSTFMQGKTNYQDRDFSMRESSGPFISGKSMRDSKMLYIPYKGVDSSMNISGSGGSISHSQNFSGTKNSSIVGSHN